MWLHFETFQTIPDSFFYPNIWGLFGSRVKLFEFQVWTNNPFHWFLAHHLDQMLGYFFHESFYSFMWPYERSKHFGKEYMYSIPLVNVTTCPPSPGQVVIWFVGWCQNTFENTMKNVWVRFSFSNWMKWTPTNFSSSIP